MNSGTQPVCTAASGKTKTGSDAKTCRLCVRTARDTRETISNGLRLIRIRYGIPFSELPDLKPQDLSKFLSFLLLQGKDRASVSFPRRQRPRGLDGLCDLQRMWRHQRWEFAHSVASIKRNLPGGCHLHSISARSSWNENAFSTPLPSSAKYLAFVRKNVSKLFPYSWDRKYADFVWRHVPNATARMNSQRADHHFAGKDKSFRGQCLTGKLLSNLPVKARYKEVMSAGKVRPLVIFDESTEILAPLHKTIYDHLKSHSWLLVGPPTEKKISSACVFSHQTSVDLVNATDNLSLDVTEAILGALLRKSTFVPGPVKLRAFQALRPLIDCDGEEKEVSHGQMMGSYLSFPLLCLHSYLAALWALRGREGTILVNGDDTLVSSSEAIESKDYPSGYLLNDLKTIRSENVAEINSTAFLRNSKGKWREVRHLRRGGFLSDYPGMLHAAAAVRDTVAWTDAFIRSRIGKKWGFLPSQLGLSPRSYVVFERTRSMWNRNFTDLPGPPKAASTLLLAVRRQLDPDEQVSMVLHQWLHGREGGKKRDVYMPTVGCIRRTYTYRAAKPVYRLSFLGKLASLKVKAYRKEEELRFLPADYVSKREDDVQKSLTAFRLSVFEDV